MADEKRAAKRLSTSKGVIPAGHPVKGLPEKEMALIEAAGGIAAPGEAVVTTEAQRFETALRYVKETRESAQAGVDEAEKAVKAAKSEAEKEAAAQSLALAKDRMIALEGAEQSVNES